MSYLIDTDLLSMLERKRVPAGLVRWIEANEGELFLSVVSFAELQFGVDRAPLAHQTRLTEWLSETRRLFDPLR